MNVRKRAEIEDTRHADDPVARKAAELVGRLRHGVERVRDNDEDASGRILDGLGDDASS